MGKTIQADRRKYGFPGVSCLGNPDKFGKIDIPVEWREIAVLFAGSDKGYGNAEFLAARKGNPSPRGRIVFRENDRIDPDSLMEHFGLPHAVLSGRRVKDENFR